VQGRTGKRRGATASTTCFPWSSMAKSSARSSRCRRGSVIRTTTASRCRPEWSCREFI